MYISNYRPRCEAVFFCFLVFLSFCLIRLLYIQFFRSRYLSGIADKQHNLFVELEPCRGTIFDANLKPQAVNIPADSLYASPNAIKDKDKEAIIRQLPAVLNLNPAYLRGRLAR
ncbi:MAG: hypothetical protein Q8N85_02835, partial [Candidatus Omnitrophota bacterium]|nr:hypothetical protein [Candidatus Omnitrophota bacterium]